MVKISVKKLRWLATKFGISMGFIEKELGTNIGTQSELTLDESEAEILLKLFSIQEVVFMLTSSMTKTLVSMNLGAK